MIIREMTHNECMAMVARFHLARLACAKDNVPYVIPIQYAHSGIRLYAFSMPGKKLDFLRTNPRACVLIDDLESRHRWKSVVLDAVFHELPSTGQRDDERLKAWTLLSDDVDWWEPGALKPQAQPTVAVSPHVFFDLEIITASGREAAA